MTNLFAIFRKWPKSASPFASGVSVANTPREVHTRKHALFTLGWKHYFAFVGVFAGLILVLCLAIPGNPFIVWYWMKVVGPTQESRYGFRAHLGSHNWYCLQISHVEPNGAFDLAGIKEGWAFWPGQNCLGHSPGEIFFRQLRDAGESNVELQFLQVGCERNQGQADIHKITVVAPRRAA